MTNKKLTQAQFIDRCKEIYIDQYLYDKTIYINTRSNVSVECKDHGTFEKMQEHLYKATDVSNVIQNGIITYNARE